MKRLLIAVATLPALSHAGARCRDDLFAAATSTRTSPAAMHARWVVAGAVTAKQRAEAREVARREKTLAAEMTRDCREQEALIKPALAGSLSGSRAAVAPPAAAAKKRAKKHGKKPAIDEGHDFIAAVPKAKKSGS
jgi:hypothetical protein